MSPAHDGACLSVVMPAYNEERTIVLALERVLEQTCVGEVIIVNDASTDGTGVVLSAVTDPRVTVLTHPTNRGKGAALRTGFANATLPFVVVHDADLEYDPGDFPRLLRPLVDGAADVVYGSRFISGEARRVLYYWHSVGNRILTTFSNMLTNINLSDMETCSKAFRREIIQALEFQEERFGFEPEVTCKVARLGCRIYEVGISYSGRTYAEGKKIGWKDGVRAIYVLLKYARWQPPSLAA